jgi:hypothetical protein
VCCFVLCHYFVLFVSLCFVLCCFVHPSAVTDTVQLMCPTHLQSLTLYNWCVPPICSHWHCTTDMSHPSAVTDTVKLVCPTHLQSLTLYNWCPTHLQSLTLYNWCPTHLQSLTLCNWCVPPICSHWHCRTDVFHPSAVTNTIQLMCSKIQSGSPTGQKLKNKLYKCARSDFLTAGPTSFSSGHSFWLLIMRSGIRFPVLRWGFFLEGEDPHGDHGLSSLVEFRFKAPPGTSYSHITIHLTGTT